MLRAREDVDPERVGLWGISQAGWIMTVAAARSDALAFVIVTSGATISVEEEGY